MKKIVLTKGRSYTFRLNDGSAIRFDNGVAKPCPDEIYDAAMATGKFTPAPDETEADAAVTGYDAMTKPQLQELAAQRGIDISACKTKADIIAVIEKADEAPAPDETEADGKGAQPDFGE